MTWHCSSNKCQKGICAPVNANSAVTGNSEQPQKC